MVQSVLDSMILRKLLQYTQTDGHATKRGLRNPPYFFIPDFLIFKHHFRLSQSSDPNVIRMLQSAAVFIEKLKDDTLLLLSCKTP